MFFKRNECYPMKLILFIVLLVGAGSPNGWSFSRGGFGGGHTNYFVPVYMPYKEFRQSFKVLNPQRIRKPGKIYIKDHYLFINEKNKGIHIIDNSRPKAPKNLAFLKILGNLDIVIKNNILYADSFIDLLAIDLSPLQKDPFSIKLVKRLKSIFPYDATQRFTNELSENMPLNVTIVISESNPSKGVVIDWIEDKGYITFRKSFSGQPFGGSSSPGAGKGGSMARFAIYKNYLYTVDDKSLQVFDIDKANKPRHLGNYKVGEEIESIFPYKNKLFIGSRLGMYAYSLKNPREPAFLSKLAHIRSHNPVIVIRDPVVVDGRYAYVTLRLRRSGQLEVIDIRDIKKPKRVKVYRLNEPYGLAKYKSYLFVCNGRDGLWIYDAKDPLNITLIRTIHKAKRKDYRRKYLYYDVIIHQQKMIVVHSKGIDQYDIKDINNIKLLSSIR